MKSQHIPLNPCTCSDADVAAATLGTWGWTPLVHGGAPRESFPAAPNHYLRAPQNRVGHTGTRWARKGQEIGQERLNALLRQISTLSPGGEGLANSILVSSPSALRYFPVMLGLFHLFTTLPLPFHTHGPRGAQPLFIRCIPAPARLPPSCTWGNSGTERIPWACSKAGTSASPESQLACWGGLSKTTWCKGSAEPAWACRHRTDFRPSSGSVPCLPVTSLSKSRSNLLL